MPGLFKTVASGVAYLWGFFSTENLSTIRIHFYQELYKLLLDWTIPHNLLNTASIYIFVKNRI